jgi:two-component system, NtrC family, sensor kinase
VRTADHADGGVMIEIRDSGRGMSAQVREHIFEPFFTTKPVGEGTGLGLSICHGIVAALGGRIELDSAPGQGSSIRVVLPAAAVEVQAAAPAAAKAAPAELEGASRSARVLVIDDEPLIGRSIARLLGSAHEVVVLTSARAALARIGAGERFEAIFCDLMMPDLSGMDLHAELARQAPEQAARMIFMTGGAFTARSRAFLEQQRFRMEKPFQRKQLFEALRQVMDKNAA